MIKDGFFKELSNYREYRNWPVIGWVNLRVSFEIEVTLALFQSLGMIPVEITKLKICVREATMKVNDSFRRQVGIPSRPSGLPKGLSFTSLRSPSMVSNWSSKVLSQDSTKSRKLTKGGFILATKLGPISVKCLLKALLSSWWSVITVSPIISFDAGAKFFFRDNKVLIQLQVALAFPTLSSKYK